MLDSCSPDRGLDQGTVDASSGRGFRVVSTRANLPASASYADEQWVSGTSAYQGRGLVSTGKARRDRCRPAVAAHFPQVSTRVKGAAGAGVPARRRIADPPGNGIRCRDETL
jgi:hypothetical protein